MNRYFLRCTGCLEIASVEIDSLPYEYGVVRIKCGICGSPVENMGRVQQGNEGSRLVKDHVRCACDERCTSARGPLCSCGCGGKNHGAGMAAVIRYTTDAGSVPTLQARTPELEAAARARFEEWATLRNELDVELNAIYARRGNGEFLPRPVFDRMRLLQQVRIDAGKAKLHATRVKKLRAVLAAAVIATSVAVAPAPVSAPVRLATDAQIGYLKYLAAVAARKGADVPAFSFDGLTLSAASSLISTLKAVAA